MSVIGEAQIIVRPVTDTFESQVRDLARGLGNVGKSNPIKPEVDASAANNAIDSISLRISGLAKEMATFALGGFGIMKIFELGKDAIIGFNSELEQSTQSFSTMLGSASQANDFLQTLQKFALKTPFQFRDLVSASQQFLAFGFKAKEIIPDLTAVGDAVAAVGASPDKLHRILYDLGEIQALGKVSGQQVRQLAMAGIPVWEILREQLHMTQDEINKVRKSADGLQADIALPALIKGLEQNYGGMMEKQSKTLMGAASNIKDAFTQTVSSLGLPLYNKLRDATIFLGNTLLTDMRTGFQKNGFTGFFDAFIKDSTKEGSFLRNSLQSIVDSILRAGREAAPIISGLGTAFKQLAEVAGGTLLVAARAFASVLATIADHAELVKVAVLAFIGLRIAEHFKNVIDSVRAWGASMVEAGAKSKATSEAERAQQEATTAAINKKAQAYRDAGVAAQQAQAMAAQEVLSQTPLLAGGGNGSQIPTTIDIGGAEQEIRATEATVAHQQAVEGLTGSLRLLSVAQAEAAAAANTSYGEDMILSDRRRAVIELALAYQDLGIAEAGSQAEVSVRSAEKTSLEAQQAYIQSIINAYADMGIVGEEAFLKISESSAMAEGAAVGNEVAVHRLSASLVAAGVEGGRANQIAIATMERLKSATQAEEVEEDRLRKMFIRFGAESEEAIGLAAAQMERLRAETLAQVEESNRLAGSRLASQGVSPIATPPIPGEFGAVGEIEKAGAAAATTAEKIGFMERAANSAMSGLKGIGSYIAGFLDPVTLAILAAAAAWDVYNTAQDKAEKYAHDIREKEIANFEKVVLKKDALFADLTSASAQAAEAENNAKGALLASAGDLTGLPSWMQSIANIGLKVGQGLNLIDAGNSFDDLKAHAEAYFRTIDVEMDKNDKNAGRVAAVMKGVDTTMLDMSGIKTLSKDTQEYHNNLNALAEAGVKQSKAQTLAAYSTEDLHRILGMAGITMKDLTSDSFDAERASAALNAALEKQAEDVAGTTKELQALADAYKEAGKNAATYWTNISTSQQSVIDSAQAVTGLNDALFKLAQPQGWTLDNYNAVFKAFGENVKNYNQDVYAQLKAGGESTQQAMKGAADATDLYVAGMSKQLIAYAEKMGLPKDKAVELAGVLTKLSGMSLKLDANPMLKSLATVELASLQAQRRLVQLQQTAANGAANNSTPVSIGNISSAGIGSGATGVIINGQEFSGLSMAQLQQMAADAANGKTSTASVRSADNSQQKVSIDSSGNINVQALTSPAGTVDQTVLNSLDASIAALQASLKGLDANSLSSGPQSGSDLLKSLGLSANPAKDASDYAAAKKAAEEAKKRADDLAKKGAADAKKAAEEAQKAADKAAQMFWDSVKQLIDQMTKAGDALASTLAKVADDLKKRENDLRGDITKPLQLDAGASIGALIRNAGQRNKLLDEYTTGIDQLRKKGLTQDTIDALRLTGPESIRELRSVLKATPNQIAQLNAQVGALYQSSQRAAYTEQATIIGDKVYDAMMKFYTSTGKGGGNAIDTVLASLSVDLSKADTQGLADAIVAKLGGMLSRR